MQCPHCNYQNTLVPLNQEEIQTVPRAWTLGQVGPRDTLYRCSNCKKLAAVDRQLDTVVKVGLAEFATGGA